MRILKPLVLALSLVGVTAMTGCSTMSTAIEKRELSAEAKMSNSVFLEPVSAEKRIAFIQIRNSSDQAIDTVKMRQELVKMLEAKSYKITDDPSKANYVLQQNILSIGKVDPKSAYSANDAGFGGAVTGAVMASALGGDNYGAAALVGTLAGVAANALVKDVYYNLVCDIQIKEKAKGKVAYTTQAASTSGTSMNTSQKISGESDYLTHVTRIIAVANKMNLEFAEAQPLLEQKLVQSVSGVF